MQINRLFFLFSLFSPPDLRAVFIRVFSLHLSIVCRFSLLPALGIYGPPCPSSLSFFFLSLSLRVECDLISASYLPAPPFFLYNNNKCYIALNSATLVRIITIKREKNWFKPTTTIYL